MALGLSSRRPSRAIYLAMTLVIVATLTYEFTRLHG